ncbi:MULTISPECIES: PIN domain-containing protein [Burkholderiaceae]|jgi:predicted nucleic acid-binding protein|uniref:Programmed cell death toxin MazF like protein n=1 Tax=Caballeronia sordidicola TaxID=196367 RepID=A0A242MDX3_CABSO|nr:pilus assembly protein [Burkholderia sp. PAMC 26561]OTP69494.1 Programmed cell death toxin MazF like protein [Caballeronia sordidicola]
MTKVFLDSNVALYLLSSDSAKANRAEGLMAEGGVISVQVLNEVANVTRRKLCMSWDETGDVLDAIRAVCSTEPLTEETHDTGRRVSERYGLSVYDSMIVAAALLAECNVLYSEDMQNGLMIDQKLRVVNPFTS